MSAGRSADGLLPAEQTLSLMRVLASNHNGLIEEQLLRDLRGMTAASWSRARNTTRKLLEYGLVTETGGRLAAVGDSSPEGVARAISQAVAEDLLRRIDANQAWNCMRLDADEGSLLIDTMMLPAMHDGIGLWLIEFGVVWRDRIESRYWQVAPENRQSFVAAAGLATPRRAKSAVQLAEELAEQALIGAAAETWVVEFEQRRLARHPLCEQIRRISEEDVAAGYDVLSFASVTSLHHDRFIEVKGHGAIKRFYWSRNEIATAREFGEDYALYLVDIRFIREAGYTPQIITGPTPELFSTEGSGWLVEPTSFEHIEIGC
jgi:hypothetical protein